jgi:hypothetical protein
LECGSVWGETTVWINQFPDCKRLRDKAGGLVGELRVQANWAGVYVG